MKKQKQKSMTRRFKREDIPLYLMALPGVVILILFSYLPMAGLLLCVAPILILYVVLQKQIIGGVVAGAVK